MISTEAGAANMNHGRFTKSDSIACYQRFSSDMQRDASLDDQLRGNMRFVEREGGDPSKVIVINDAAASGTRFRRPGYLQLLDLIDKRNVTAVIVESVSRLSRDNEHGANLFKRATRNKVRLLGVTDGIDSFQKGAKAFFTMKTMMNDAFIDDLREATLRGLEGRAAANMSTGGRTYGYRSEPRKNDFGDVIGYPLVSYEPEANVVVQIFELYDAGMSTRRLAMHLTAAKIPSPRANPKPGFDPKYCPKTWGASTVREILRNTRYIGTWRYKERKWTRENSLDAESERRVPERRAPSEVMHLTCPTIIDRALWDRVRARAKAVTDRYTKDEDGNAKGRAKHPGKATVYPTSGVVHCECGTSMVIAGGSSARYYRCGANMKRGPEACPNSQSVREDVLREAVLGALDEHLATTEAASYYLERLKAELTTHARDSGADLKQLRQELAKTERGIGNLAKAVAEGGLSEELGSHLRAYKTQAERQRATIADLERESREPLHLPTPEDVCRQYRTLTEIIATDPTRGREALLNLFEGGRLTLEPQGNGRYLARSRFFPMAVLTIPTPDTRTPKAGGLGRRATALCCAGRI